MSDNVVAELTHRLAQAEAEYDALALRLAIIEDAVSGEERIPGPIVERLASGEAPVRVWREYRGRSLRALARETNISSALLSEIENGKKEGSLKTLSALARALGVDLDDLVPWPQE
jgi:DNA-binding Xre family transcriptional regulator